MIELSPASKWQLIKEIELLSISNFIAIPPLFLFKKKLFSKKKNNYPSFNFPIPHLTISVVTLLILCLIDFSAKIIKNVPTITTDFKKKYPIGSNFTKAL